MGDFTGVLQGQRLLERLLLRLLVPVLQRDPGDAAHARRENASVQLLQPHGVGRGGAGGGVETKIGDMVDAK